MASKHLKTKASEVRPSHTAGKHTGRAEEPDESRTPAKAAPKHTGKAVKAESPAERAPKKKRETPAAHEAPAKKNAPEKKAEPSKKAVPPEKPASPAPAPAPAQDNGFRAALLAAAEKQAAENTKGHKKNKKVKAPAPEKAPQKPSAAASESRPEPKKADNGNIVRLPLSTARIPTEEQNDTDAPISDAKKKKKKRRKTSAADDSADFRLDEPEARKLTAHDIRIISILLIFLLILIAAAVLLWFNRGIFSADNLSLTLASVVDADDEYIFDAGSGQVFAPTGDGLAVATAGAVELLNNTGTVAASCTVQIDNTAIASCDDFALFYDQGGSKLVQLTLAGGVNQITAEGNIVSATVSDSGYIAVTTDATGYRALVTVYDHHMNIVYQWYSSTAWIMSAEVSPDGRSLAVLSYTMGGSEICFFRLSQEEQQAVFEAPDILLLDFSWLDSSHLCACSTDAAYFFDSSGKAGETYLFNDQFLTDCTYGGEGFMVIALSQYRSGTASTLVSLDTRGNVLGSVDISGELVSLTASGTEILVLNPTGATLYTSDLQEKGTLNGLTGFKYATIRGRGEALLIASNYAEVYTFQ